MGSLYEAPPPCASESYRQPIYVSDAQRPTASQTYNSKYTYYPNNSQPNFPGLANLLQAQPSITYPSQQPSTPVSSTTSQQNSQQDTSASLATSGAPKHSTKPVTPTPAYSNADSRRDSTAMIPQCPRVTDKTSPSGGSLSDFAAQTCCFLWFETFDILLEAERPLKDGRTVPPLTKLAVPHSPYKKWVHSIISTTQVSKNVVLLALLFIHRLKHTTRKVLPQPGSEYRLLTVALMLGNKFLDDNTYTNKTWAEVSGMTVQEIHVMEVEFLSNMRYNLYATTEDWQKWIEKIENVQDYCERATPRQSSPISLYSPHHSFHHSPLPSPTGSNYSGIFAPAQTSRQGSLAPNWSFSGGSPLAKRPSLASGRKRSFEGDPAEPPAKRTTARPPSQLPAPASTSALFSSLPSSFAPTAPSHAVQSHSNSHEPSRLPAPALSLNTQLPAPAPAPTSASHQPTTPGAYAAQSSLALPPLGQGARAMSTVFPPSLVTSIPATTTYSAPVTTMASTGAGAASMPAYASGYHTPTRRHSPTNPALRAAYMSSPLGEPYPHHGAHTPITQSPSIYLQQRASPYRPIRNVNTLLYPPPSASLHEYHLTPSQMHYQPLGRRDDVRTGIVPEYRSYRHQNMASQPINRGPLLHPSVS